MLDKLRTRSVCGVRGKCARGSHGKVVKRRVSHLPERLQFKKCYSVIPLTAVRVLFWCLEYIQGYAISGVRNCWFALFELANHNTNSSITLHCVHNVIVALWLVNSNGASQHFWTRAIRAFIFPQFFRIFPQQRFQRKSGRCGRLDFLISRTPGHDSFRLRSA